MTFLNHRGVFFHITFASDRRFLSAFLLLLKLGYKLLQSAYFGNNSRFFGSAQRKLLLKSLHFNGHLVYFLTERKKLSLGIFHFTRQDGGFFLKLFYFPVTGDYARRIADGAAGEGTARVNNLTVQCYYLKFIAVFFGYDGGCVYILYYGAAPQNETDNSPVLFVAVHQLAGDSLVAVFAVETSYVKYVSAYGCKWEKGGTTALCFFKVAHTPFGGFLVVYYNVL